MTDPVAEALWSKVLATWDDEASHRAFVQHCQSTDQLADAARLYRTQAHPDGEAHDEPGRQTDARKRLAAIAFLAVATLDAARGLRPDPEDRPQAVRLFGYATLFILLIGLVWMMSRLWQ